MLPGFEWHCGNVEAGEGVGAGGWIGPSFPLRPINAAGFKLDIARCPPTRILPLADASF